MVDEQQKREKSKAPDDTIFVGQKQTMAYVLAIITQFSEGINTVHVKARGRAISKAVDVAEVVRHKFMKDLKYKVDIATDQIQGEEGGKFNVSSIDIALSK